MSFGIFEQVISMKTRQGKNQMTLTHFLEIVSWRDWLFQDQEEMMKRRLKVERGRSITALETMNNIYAKSCRGDGK
jgi:hypothetical protein